MILKRHLKVKVKMIQRKKGIFIELTLLLFNFLLPFTIIAFRTSAKDKAFERNLQKAIEISKTQGSVSSSDSLPALAQNSADVIIDENSNQFPSQDTIILEENMSDYKKEKEQIPSEKPNEAPLALDKVNVIKNDKGKIEGNNF